MAILRTTSGSNAGSVYEITRENLLVGRDLDATIQVADQGVSRRHAEIIRVGELCLLKDCGSRNGTFINDDKVTERVLREGDRIRVGNTIFVFEDRPELLEESHLIHFHDGNFSPNETVCLRTTKMPGNKLAAIRQAGEYRESPLLSSVDRIAQIVAGEKPLPEILRDSVAEVGETTQASTAYVFNRRKVDGRDEYNLVASWAAEKQDGKTPLRVSRSVMRQACRDKSTILVSNAERDERFKAQESIVMQRLHSILCAPLKVHNKVYGILYAADSQDPKGFSTEDMELLSAVATQLGLAIAFARSQRLHDAFFRKAMRVLVSAIEHRQPQRKGAADRIANFCAAIARAMHLGSADVRYAWLSGLLHDISVLGLSDRELEEAVLLPLRRTRAAELLLGELSDMEPVLDAIRDQEERYDGSGQPEGKQGDSIPLLAQVLGLAKNFDGLLSGDISSGGEMPVRDAVLRINELKGKQFPVRVVNGLLVAYRQGQLFKDDQHFSLVAM